ncbi:hypothetical protein F2Q70_00015388 [Brassica cretica]|uniref:Uncharacterized protein n=1 Tax=Brassica cretica TaxID=69181 RepID=A0A8S9HWF9_BRACR|nr:hypothetical protein F2Q70_00015388 [Brassica cretica]
MSLVPASVPARVPDQLQPKTFLILAQTFATREQLQHVTSSSFATASDSSRPVRVQLAAQLLWWSNSTII